MILLFFFNSYHLLIFFYANSGVVANPFEFADIVTTTTHKSLRGPRSGMIFFRRDDRDFEKDINWAVFPALQGGPHEHQIAGVAAQLKEVISPTFKDYCRQVVSNAKSLAESLKRRGYTLCTGGTDNHLILWDLRPNGLTGSKVELVCDAAGITLNKNSVPGDKSAMSPGGVRIGTPALTTRGFMESDFEVVAEYLDRAVQIALSIQSESGKSLKVFREHLKSNQDVNDLHAKVIEFASKFYMPGI